MAIDVTVDLSLARPPDEVYARIADIEAWPTWLIASGIVAVHRTSTGAVRSDERFTVEQRAAGRAGTFDVNAIVVEPPTRLVVEGRDREGVSIGIEATLTPVGTGTRLRWSIRIGLPFRYRIFESMARPEVERAAALDLEAFRRGLESSPAD
jgi:uncharacterized protein YndB with AHSA1/START domain